MSRVRGRLFEVARLCPAAELRPRMQEIAILRPGDILQMRMSGTARSAKFYMLTEDALNLMQDTLIWEAQREREERRKCVEIVPKAKEGLIKATEKMNVQEEKIKQLQRELAEAKVQQSQPTLTGAKNSQYADRMIQHLNMLHEELQELKRCDSDLRKKDEEVSQMKQQLEDIEQERIRLKEHFTGDEKRSQMMIKWKGPLHDVKGQYPKKRQKRPSNTGHRLCYQCRCRGHLAVDRPIVTSESALGKHGGLLSPG